MNRKAMILLSAALMTVAVSCEETGKQEEEKLKAPELKANVKEVEIVALNDEKALELTWTAAAESGVSYMLQYGLEGSKETKAVSCGTEMSKGFTVNELDAIRADLGVAEETNFKLSFLVEAKSSTVVLPVQSELVTVNVVYNIPVPEPLELYGIGDASHGHGIEARPKRWRPRTISISHGQARWKPARARCSSSSRMSPLPMKAGCLAMSEMQKARITGHWLCAALRRRRHAVQGGQDRQLSSYRGC